MNLETFFSNFELFADAPNGVQKLRELILQLAVQGKLVPQNPSDEPAAVLLEKIKEEKERLVKEGKIKKSKELPSVDVGEMAFDLPEGWEWVRLDFICSKITDGVHKTPKYTNDGVHFLSVTHLKNGELDFRNTNYISREDHQVFYERCDPQKGDVLMCKVGATIGVTAVVEVDLDFSIFVQLALFKQIFINSYYLKFSLLSSNIQNYIKENSFGSAMPYISIQKLKNIQIPLPPLNEQHRIVTKVDALMKLCDELETRQLWERDRILKLGEVATTKLLTPTTKETFNQHWKTISDNFDLLYSTPENVKQLRQAILQLAVMGKLVPQNPSDEPAAVLLEKIKAQKERLVKEGKIKKSKELPPVDVGEMAFELPEGWEWVKIDDIYEVVGGIQKTPKRNPVSNYFPYLRVANVYRGQLNLSEIKYFELFEGELERWCLISGDLLIVEGNGSDREIGRCAVWNEEIKNCVHQNHLIRSRPIGHEGSLFTLLFFNSFNGMEEMKRLAITTSGLYSLSVGKIRGIVVPLPPLNEQHRIVTKVNQLMCLCDELEAKLTQSISDREKLMSAAVRQVLAA